MGTLHQNAIAAELAARPVTPARVLVPGTFRNAIATVGSDGTVTDIQDGPRAVPVTSPTTGVLTFPGGIVLQWGKSGAAATGGSSAVVAVVFPQAFVNPPTVTCDPDALADGTGNFPFVCTPSNITNTGFNANFSCAVLIGGTGAAGISNAVHAGWHAIGV